MGSRCSSSRTSLSSSYDPTIASSSSSSSSSSSIVASSSSSSSWIQPGVSAVVPLEGSLRL